LAQIRRRLWGFAGENKNKTIRWVLLDLHHTGSRISGKNNCPRFTHNLTTLSTLKKAQNIKDFLRLF
ncbi:MAG: hypothetical protein ACRCTY_02435, partial [Candidatus Adiutrix sp.]